MLPATHPPIKVPKLGVLLVNLGTPDAPTTGAVRRYLKEFLSDRRVVEIPDRKSTRLNSSHLARSRMPSSA